MSGADVVYTDEDKIDPSGGRRQAHFKPDWSPELLDSCMYVSHFTVMRRRLVVEAGGFRAGFDGSQDYDLMLRVAERTDRVAHVPRVLYGWRMAPDSAASSQLAKPWAIRAGQRALEEAITAPRARGLRRLRRSGRTLPRPLRDRRLAGHVDPDAVPRDGARGRDDPADDPWPAPGNRRRGSAGSRPLRWRRGSTPWRGARRAITCSSSMTMSSRAGPDGSTR